MRREGDDWMKTEKREETTGLSRDDRQKTSEQQRRELRRWKEKKGS